MIFSRSHSIRQKLNAILVVTTVSALLVAGIALLLIDLRKQVRTIENNLLAQADIVGLASSTALAFDDPQAAAENLSVLRANPGVAVAALYDKAGRLFATFRPDAGGLPDVAPKAPATGVRFSGEWVVASRPVVQNHETIGTVYLQARHDLMQRVLEYLGVLAAVLTGSLAVALVLSNRLQRLVTAPIVDVSEVAQEILLGGNFDLRAQKTTDDEVGALVDGFNAMLDELNRRAATLGAAHQALLATERTLQDANRAKDEFIATLAHELRNPLAPIRTGLELLKRDKANGPASERARGIMERQMVHLVRLIDDLLDISRITSGKIRLEKARIGLRAVVESALEISRPAMEAGRHELAVELPRQDVELVADATRLAQSVGNLLTNAAKYTPPGGHIHLRLWQEDSTAVIEVQDDGVGIPADMLENVFTLFTQVGRTIERAQGGLGIGLSLVRSLVTLHGGTVTAASPGPALGCTFTIRIPCLPALAPAAEPAAQAAAGAPPAPPRRVLVVDDNIDAATTLAEVLGLLGHTTRLVHTGTEVFDAAADFRPDTVLLDIGLPGMSGYDAARQLRADRRFDKTVLVALTGWGSENDKREAEEAGFNHHLTKPVDLEAVTRLVERP
ncbi:MAG: ATP-binding protein [Pseudomonadota bacterium]